MNIGILTSTNPQLRQQLAAKETTDAKAQAAESDTVAEVAVAKARPTGNTAPSVKFASMRAALDARVAADVSSGQLSASDAATVAKALDAIDSRSDGSAGSRQPATLSTAAFLMGRASHASAVADNVPAQVAQDYLATIDRGTLVDRWA